MLSRWATSPPAEVLSEELGRNQSSGPVPAKFLIDFRLPEARWGFAYIPAELTFKLQEETSMKKLLLVLTHVVLASLAVAQASNGSPRAEAQPPALNRIR